MTPPAHSSEDMMVVLFDGVCNLCNSWVDRAIQRDRRSRLRFLVLQTPAAAALLRAVGHADMPLSTIVVVEQGRVYLRSTAVLRVARAMGLPWRWAWPMLVWIPAPLRDVLYRAVAAIRYRVFGRRNTCRVPTGEEQARFLAADDVPAAFNAAGLPATSVDVA